MPPTQPHRPQSLPLTAAVTAADIAAYLRRAGLIVLSTAEPDDTQDGEIGLGGGVHVQCGVGYACVNRWDEGPGLLYCGLLRYDARDLLPDIEVHQEQP